MSAIPESRIERDLKSGLGVTASVPCFGANRYVRRAVESLLAQTHRDLTVVVVNDGHPNPPWRELAGVCDPRLIRFSLEGNHGPYFAHHVVLAASDTPYFMTQDADDWSDPERVAKLLARLLADNCSLAFSAWQQYREDETGVIRPEGVRWRRRNRWHFWRRFRRTPVEDSIFDPVPTDAFINRANHQGVFRRTALEEIGGYYGGFRINHDTLLTNLLLITGKISFVEAPLYHCVIRRNSLSHSAATGARSAFRAGVRAQQAEIYREALAAFRRWKEGAIARDEFLSLVRRAATRSIAPPDRAAIDLEVQRLRNVMRRHTYIAGLGL